MSVVIETTLGDLTIDLYLKERPNTCLNFLKLCKIKYYNLCLFHKIEKNFIAQSGDPSGTGRGGESIFCHLYGDQAKYFDSEFKPRLKHEKLGTISMVNNGNNMNGSQFFFTLGENLTYLDEVHTVFGEVVEGFDILLKLNEAICDGSNRPYQDIRITHTVLLHDPYVDPVGLDIPDASPEPTREQLESGYIAADEEIDDTKGKNAKEIEEKIKESEAKARATILEMVGDIPDVDVKPPENVLFVCKLNPVTTSEDLEIIFSRFGPIVSCEVIKDRKTGESLQYAFIEFEKEEDCENAYFKMDNVLIDDRRIHVDFSQSVSKMNWDKDGKFSNSKVSKDKVILKNTSKGSDGYDMIFDLNVPKDTSSRKRDAKQISKSVEKKHSHSSKKEKIKSKSPQQKYLRTSEKDNFRGRSRSISPFSKRKKYTKNDNLSSDFQNLSYKSYTDKSHRPNSSQKYTCNIRDYSPDSHFHNREHSSKYYSHKEYDSKSSDKCRYSPNRSYKCSNKNIKSSHHEEPSKVSHSYPASTYREREKIENIHKQHSSIHSQKRYDSEDFHQSRDKKCKSSHKEIRRSSDYSPRKKSHKKKKSFRSSSVSSSSSVVHRHSKKHETSSESSYDSSPYENRKQYEQKKKVHTHSNKDSKRKKCKKI